MVYLKVVKKVKKTTFPEQSRKEKRTFGKADNGKHILLRLFPFLSTNSLQFLLTFILFFFFQLYIFTLLLVLLFYCPPRKNEK